MNVRIHANGTSSLLLIPTPFVEAFGMKKVVLRMALAVQLEERKCSQVRLVVVV